MLPDTLDLMPPARRPAPAAGTPLVEVDGLSVHFPAGHTGFWGQKQLVVHAVDDVTFSIAPGETLGLVGESGSGKTTTGRAVLRRVAATRGTIRFRGADITQTAGEELRQLRKHMQLIFQDPYASLNPRMRIGEIVAEPLLVHGIVRDADQARALVVDLLQRVGLPADAVDRHPHAFSGGQRQRVGIARALALQQLQQDLGLTYLFIAHDLSVVQHISHRIAIMYAGHLVEIAPSEAIYADPKHPYTEALLSAVPIPDPKVQRRRQRIVYSGEVPSPISPPPGCRFASRCPKATGQCAAEVPPLEQKAPGHLAACWHS